MNDAITDEGYRSPELQRSIAKHQAEKQSAVNGVRDDCPFCGGKAEVERIGTNRQSSIISCSNCGCMLEANETWDTGERWNTRWAPEDGCTCADHQGGPCAFCMEAKYNL